jgi:hypothetical protein
MLTHAYFIVITGLDLLSVFDGFSPLRSVQFHGFRVQPSFIEVFVHVEYQGSKFHSSTPSKIDDIDYLPFPYVFSNIIKDWTGLGHPDLIHVPTFIDACARARVSFTDTGA